MSSSGANSTLRSSKRSSIFSFGKKKKSETSLTKSNPDKSDTKNFDQTKYVDQLHQSQLYPVKQKEKLVLRNSMEYTASPKIGREIGKDLKGSSSPRSQTLRNPAVNNLRSEALPSIHRVTSRLQESPKPSPKPRPPPFVIEETEDEIMESLKKNNTLMRRKINHDVLGKEARKSVNAPLRPLSKEKELDPDVAVLKKRIAELEKKEEMYKARINELEQQVGQFSMFHLLNNPIVKEINEQNQQLAAHFDKDDYKRDLPAISDRSSSLFENHKKKSSASSSPTESSHHSEIQIPVDNEASRNNWLQQFTNFMKPQERPQEKLLALYDYSAGNETTSRGRLSFKEGQVMILIRKSSQNGWWVAELDGKTGRVPSNYVEQLDSSSAFKAKVSKRFNSQQEGDLQLKKDDFITVLKTQENGWYLGEKVISKDGAVKYGFFPSDCVERLSSNDVPPYIKAA